MRICLDCGEREDRADLFCVMSDDGEGPHAWGRREPIDTETAAFLRRVEIHHEQGAQER